MAAATSTTRKAAPKKGAAATSGEKKPKTIKAGGLSFKIPPVMPGMVLIHFGDIEGGKVLSPVQGLIKDVLGEDQYAKVIAHIRTLDADKTGELLGELADKITSAYGLAAGE